MDLPHLCPTCQTNVAHYGEKYCYPCLALFVTLDDYLKDKIVKPEED